MYCKFIDQATRTMEEYDLLQCIDKALDSFGSSVKSAIFLRLTMSHNSGRSEVISDPNILARVISEAFGSGAKGIEMAIIAELRKRFMVSTKGMHSLVEAISDAKKQIITTMSPVSLMQAPIHRLQPSILA